MKFVIMTVVLLASVFAKKIAFAFELVRHGARNGFVEKFETVFPVSIGMLTRSGMRQRYLLGKRTRERYTK